MRMAAILFVSGLLMSCAKPTGHTRPDGRVFESHAELMQYLKEHPEERARLDPEGRLTTGEAHPPNIPLDPSPGSLAHLDFKNGFRDLTFGDPPTEEMQLVEDGTSKYYRRPGDDRMIGNAHLHEIAYAFYHDQFSSVILQTKGIVNSRALLSVLRQAYGPGMRPNEFMERYVWKGNRVLLYYDEQPITHDATIIMWSVPLKNAKEAEERAKARKGVSGL
jgi:hypothetical protein